MSAGMRTGSEKCHQIGSQALKVWVEVYYSSNSVQHQFVLYKELFQVTSPFHNMSSRNFDLCLGESWGGRIARTGCQAMISHQPLSSRDNFYRGAAAMAIDYSKFSCLSGQKYEKSFDKSACYFGFEKTLSGGRICWLRNPVRPVMDCIEQPSTRQLVYSIIVSVFFTKTHLRALLTGQEVPARAQLLW